jgi:pyruvate formate lyase activating enzyme
METNGYFGDKLSDAELASLDLVLLGIKTWGSERHKALTGVEIEPTLAFARRLADAGKPMWIRFVLVPGLTDDAAVISGIAEFAASLGTVQRVEVLPFHQLGKFKWERLGLDYTLEDARAPSPEEAERACEIFRAAGLAAH